MSLRLRLQRFGSKNRPFYHVVVTPSRAPRNGSFIERLGFYNPLSEPSVISLNEERLAHWYGLGAQPSESVQALLRAQKIQLKRKES